MFSWRNAIGILAVIVSAIVMPQLTTTIAKFWFAVGSGFVSGAVSTGSLRGGLIGAFSAAAFFGIGAGFDKLSAAHGEGFKGFLNSGLSAGEFGAKVLAHGITGGVMSELSGGKFGDGFAGAGVAQLFSPAIDQIGGGKASYAPLRIAAAALLGGTASVLSGGKFANGAITGAFSRAFNEELSKKSERQLAQETGEKKLASYLSGWDEHNPNYHRYPIGPTELCTIGEMGCSFNMGAPIVASNSVPVSAFYFGEGAYNLPFGLRVDPIWHSTPASGVWINDTRFGHRYHPGRVGHALYESSGKLWLYTVGIGVGPNPANNVLWGNRLFGGMHLNVRGAVLDQQIGP